jgi:hypothetical protein
MGGGQARDDDGGGRPVDAAIMRAVVTVPGGYWAVDLETEEVEPATAPLTEPEVTVPQLPRVLDADASGSTVLALVDAKPPLLVSHDAGLTWNESGRGLPSGVAVSVSKDDPDVAAYATHDRLYVTLDGGRFWRRLEPELENVEDVQLEP